MSEFWNILYCKIKCFLFQRFKSAGVGRTLIDDIVAKCGRDWRQYAVWEHNICLLLHQGCSVELAHLWLTCHHGTVDLLTADASSSPLVDDQSNAAALKSEATERVQVLEKLIKEILAELENGRLRIKSHFLFTSCGDPRHKRCGGTADDGRCNELAAKVYQHLSSLDATWPRIFPRGKVVPTKLADILRADYPQFQWAVILTVRDEARTVRSLWKLVQESYVTNPSKRKFFLTRLTTYRHEICTAGSKPVMWVQEHGTERASRLFGCRGGRAAAKFGCIHARGLKYGELICSRLRKGGRAGVKCRVLWTETKNVVEGINLLNQRNCAVSPESFFGTGLSCFGDLSFERCADFLFVHQEACSSAGSRITMDLARMEGGVTFPLLFGKYHDTVSCQTTTLQHVLFWPIEGRPSGGEDKSKQQQLTVL